MQKPLYSGFVFITMVFTLSCTNTKKDLSIFDKKKINQEESKNIVSYLSQGGIMKARLSAPLMIRYTSDSTRVEFPNGLHTEFFVEKKEFIYTVDSNTVESHIFSKYGKYTEFNNKVYLKDSVVCYNAIKKDTLWCDDLWWDQDRQIIYTWGNFRFKTHDGQDMKGTGEKTGFTAKQDLTEYTLYRSTGVMVAPAGTLPN